MVLVGGTRQPHTRFSNCSLAIFDFCFDIDIALLDHQDFPSLPEELVLASMASTKSLKESRGFHKRSLTCKTNFGKANALVARVEGNVASLRVAE